MTKSRRWCIHQVPDKPLKSSSAGQYSRRPEPISRDLIWLFIDWLCFVGARIPAYQLVLIIVDFQRHGSVRIGWKVIVNYCSVRRILSDRFFWWQWGICVYVSLHSISDLWREQPCSVRR